MNLASCVSCARAGSDGEKKEKKNLQKYKKNLQEFRSKIKHVGLVFELRCSMKLTFQSNFVVATRVFFLLLLFFSIFGVIITGPW